MAQINANTSVIAAKIAGESSAMDAAAAKVEAKVRARASQHVRTGKFLESIHTTSARGKKGVRDRVVYSDHPKAQAIEFGHTTENGTHVEGMFAFVGARGDL